MESASTLSARIGAAIIASISDAVCVTPTIIGPHDTSSAALEPDLRIRVPLADHVRTLLVECRPSGQPRHARNAVNALLRCRHDMPDVYPIFGAPYVSPRSAALCKAANVGYADLCGNCRLCFDGIYILKEGQPNQSPQRREQRSLYSARATRVLRVCLVQPHRTWKLTELAATARVSIGHAANVTRRLTDREWMRRTSDGLLLTDAAGLLADWAHEHTFRRSHVAAYYSLRSAAETETALAAACEDAALRYALTGFSAAARFAPVVRYQHISAYIDADPAPIATRLGLEHVSSGANIFLLQPYDTGVFYGTQSIGGTRVVSTIQTYLDVKDHPGRGPEAAEALLEQVIAPTWQT